MDLRKLKTIFIFVLVVLNLVLGIIMFNIAGKDKAIAADTRNAVAKLLQRDMIYFAPELQIPPSPGISNVYIERMAADNEEFAARMLDGQYSVNDKSVYVNGNKSLKITGDEFVYVNSAPGGTVSDFSEKSIEEVCRKEMSALGIKEEFYKFGGINRIKDGVRAVFTVQNEEDVFFDAYISMDVSAKGVTSVSGKNLISKMTVSKISGQYFSASSVLLELPGTPGFDRTGKTVIMSIKHGYYIGGNVETFSNILAIPVWQIMTDSGQILYFDARNGEYII